MANTGISYRAIAIAMMLAITPVAGAEPDAIGLSDGFQTPPPEARPRTWWHWMNGNVTAHGIQADLDWMHSIGIGGVQNFDASLMTPQIVDKRLVYMTPEWQEAFRLAVATAQEKGMEFAIAASPGWSETGGPWVPPEDGMKKLTWSELIVEGGKPIGNALPAAPNIVGPFQDMELEEEPFFLSVGAKDTPNWSNDIAVLAIPMKRSGELPAFVATDAEGHELDAHLLVDHSYAETLQISEGDETAPSFVRLEYPEPVTIRSAAISSPGAAGIFTGAKFQPELQASMDGESFAKVATLSLDKGPQTTVSFPAVTARFFRMAFYPNPELADGTGLEAEIPGTVVLNMMPGSTSSTITLAELRLETEARIDRFEVKAGFGYTHDYIHLPDTADDAVGIAPDQVIDISDKLTPDGRLDWTPPPGKWRILRLGYSLTGKTNHPATAEATGLEVDKYDGEAVERYLRHYLSLYKETLQTERLPEKGLNAILTDSIEVGAANWTHNLLDAFQQKRGYDARPWLPTLAGVIIGDRAASDRFLNDFRQTLGDLIVDEHYAVVARIAEEEGLTLYGEAMENGRPVLGDDLAMRQHADVPMAAMWTYPLERGPRRSLIADIKGAASVAHIYGQNLTAAESLTSAFAPWAYGPDQLKPIIDREFVLGVNRVVFHTSVHQPVDDKQPGLSLMIFGQHFNRHETWADMAKPWVDYVSRTSFMLQQGRNHADVAYIYGEDAPLTAQFQTRDIADAPQQWAYDFVNAQMLKDIFTVEDGMISAPSGAQYKAMMVGGPDRAMTLGTLKRIAELADAGVPLIGKPPNALLSEAESRAEFDAIVARLWPDKASEPAATDVALAASGLEPDLTVHSGADQANILFLHRALQDGHIYFLNNIAEGGETTTVSFPASGLAPELWNAVTGQRTPLSYTVAEDRIQVTLDLSDHGSAMVVFRAPLEDKSHTQPGENRVTLDSFGDGWMRSFEPGRGAPTAPVRTSTGDWSQSDDPAVRYFSGDASYTRTFKVKRKWLRGGRRLELDLGEIGDVAEVIINGQSAGIVWTEPHRVDVTDFVKKGENTLEIRVANLWVNRLIGDQQQGVADEDKVAFVTIPTFYQDAPLRPSGLLEPVKLVCVTKDN